MRRFLKTITSRAQIPVNAHAPIKDGTVSSHYCAFVWWGKNDPKTQRVDADSFLKRDAGDITYPDIFENEDFASVLALRPHNAIVIIPLKFKSVKRATCGRVFAWKRRKNSRFSKIPWYVWTQGLRENLCCCNSCYTVGSLSNDVSEQRTSTEVDFLHSSAVILNKFLGKTSLQELRLLAIQTC